jgi:hypothetical protein
MKKLMILAVASLFSFSAAAYACDGTKGHDKASDTQAKGAKDKDSKKKDQTDTKS